MWIGDDFYDGGVNFRPGPERVFGNMRSVSYQFEGTIYNNETIEKMRKLIHDNHIFDTDADLKSEAAIEELMMPILEFYFNKKFFHRICKVFWTDPFYNASIENINEQLPKDNNVFMVKRVGRNIDDKIRMYINNLKTIPPTIVFSRNNPDKKLSAVVPP